MSFCKYSSEFLIETSTSIDNAFFNDYLPFAPDACVKVYLYGLYLCTQPTKENNTLEHFSKVLNMPIEDVESAFYYWQQEGLVQILEKEPFEVAYLPVKENLGKLKKFDDKKYGAFNIELQELIVGRMITPTEYKEYYELIESFHIEPAAVLMIVRYATSLKGGSVGYKYITTIIKNWAYEGILTTQAVEEKLIELERSSADLLEVLLVLGLKKQASLEERNLFIKWTKEYGFLLETIKQVAKTLKRVGGFIKLDRLLTKYYQLHLFSFEEITSYELEKEYSYTLAKQLTKNIGVYYENLDPVVENYLTDWLRKGFAPNTLLIISTYAFKKSIRTLEELDAIIKKFYKLGLITEESIAEYIKTVVETDKQISTILETCGLHRKVIASDRDNFNLWLNTWHFSMDVVLYAASLAKDKLNPVSYLNKILSNWKEAGVTTLEQAKTNGAKLQEDPTITTKPASFQTHSYSNNELNALFDNLDEVEI